MNRNSDSSTCLSRFVGGLDGLLGTLPSSLSLSLSSSSTTTNLVRFLVVGAPLLAKGLLEGKVLLETRAGLLANGLLGVLLVLGFAGAGGATGFLRALRVLGVAGAGVAGAAATVRRLVRLATAAAAPAQAASAAFFASLFMSWRTFFACAIRNCVAHSRPSAGFSKFARAY